MMSLKSKQAERAYTKNGDLLADILESYDGILSIFSLDSGVSEEHLPLFRKYIQIFLRAVKNIDLDKLDYVDTQAEYEIKRQYTVWLEEYEVLPIYLEIEELKYRYLNPDTRKEVYRYIIDSIERYKYDFYNLNTMMKRLPLMQDIDNFILGYFLNLTKYRNYVNNKPTIRAIIEKRIAKRRLAELYSYYLSSQEMKKMGVNESFASTMRQIDLNDPDDWSFKGYKGLTSVRMKKTHNLQDSETGKYTNLKDNIRSGKVQTTRHLGYMNQVRYDEMKDRVLARNDIKANTTIEIAPVRVLNKVDMFAKGVRDLTFEIIPKRLYGLPLGYILLYNQNDSLFSNARYRFYPETQSIEIISKRDIKKGEEIVIEKVI